MRTPRRSPSSRPPGSAASSYRAVGGLADLGYEGDESFNLLSAHGQLLFHDPLNGRQLDA